MGLLDCIACLLTCGCSSADSFDDNSRRPGATVRRYPSPPSGHHRSRHRRHIEFWDDTELDPMAGGGRHRMDMGGMWISGMGPMLGPMRGRGRWRRGGTMGMGDLAFGDMEAMEIEMMRGRGMHGRGIRGRGMMGRGRRGMGMGGMGMNDIEGDMGVGGMGMGGFGMGDMQGNMGMMGGFGPMIDPMGMRGIQRSRRGRRGRGRSQARRGGAMGALGALNEEVGDGGGPTDGAAMTGLFHGGGDDAPGSAGGDDPDDLPPAYGSREDLSGTGHLGGIS
ncbi:hypothetical protein P152DRAFT_451717 [Eremomyces bilateralis CBS 781.70]|uniref:Uncharacterized protein n=1 Tax=Eremomyces bilateralis CBS 781.70 TaxID=1392243 RepID=A0A6G1FVM7_9PEZI|nr:uncharacterized protein P152DRAFT_451717 [Eremomyces bilateralis CBS 781.70]KAF1809768.1 hypothetical protein P152DRAFT_451717 [Eremomyces bilateralis CBS 781.70]